MAEADPTTAGVYQGRQDAASTTFDPGELEWNKTYYWRVDEVNEADAGSPWKGSLWSFTTADFLVIDDFESYTDDEGSRIYQTWLDDWADTACGSTVGYLEAPFAEQTIVHGGSQSMPLDYNNVCSPHYSEIEREFPPQRTGLSTASTRSCSTSGARRAMSPPRCMSRFRTAPASSALSGTLTPPIVQTATQWTPVEDSAERVHSRRRERRQGQEDATSAWATSPSRTAGSYGLIFVDDIWVIKP